MFLRYDKKDKRKYLIFKGIVLAGIIGSFFIAGAISKMKPPSIDEKMKVDIGWIIIGIVVFMGFINYLKVFIKFKSLGFILVSLILFLMSSVIDVIVISTAVVSIPLLFDDAFVKTYFKYLNMTKYYEDYVKLHVKVVE